MSPHGWPTPCRLPRPSGAWWPPHMAADAQHVHFLDAATADPCLRAYGHLEVQPRASRRIAPRSVAGSSSQRSELCACHVENAPLRHRRALATYDQTSHRGCPQSVRHVTHNHSEAGGAVCEGGAPLPPLASANAQSTWCARLEWWSSKAVVWSGGAVRGFTGVGCLLHCVKLSPAPAVQRAELRGGVVMHPRGDGDVRGGDPVREGSPTEARHAHQPPYHRR